MIGMANPTNKMVVWEDIVLGDTRVVVVHSPTQETFNTLPDAIEFDGEVFGRSAWCSESGKAFYNHLERFATPISIYNQEEIY
jgi:hypothetical protein